MNVKCSWCKKKFDLNKEFRDVISRKEYQISGFCQNCQDKTFNENEGSEEEQ